VKSAIGYDESRGDRVEMASVPFQAPVVGERGWLDTAGDAADGLTAYVPRLLGIGVVLVMFLSFVRPALRRLATQPTFRGRDVGALEAAGGAPDMEALVSQLETENRRLTAEDPERAAYLVRQWLQARD
jgi:flagellar biosynthesis/type III secretory pathway M-ring protein FliF/YscJ